MNEARGPSVRKQNLPEIAHARPNLSTLQRNRRMNQRSELMKNNLHSLVSLLTAVGCLATSSKAVPEHLDVNDVSWLFPTPAEGEKLGTLISIDSLKDAEGQTLWPQAAFESILAIAASDDASVSGFRIKLPSGADKMSTWKVAGVRFDPSAPGGSPKIIEKFGSDPQIRLILQPVSGTPPSPQDVTIHLIYSFSEEEKGAIPDDTFRKALPNKTAFLAVVKDLRAVKVLSTELGATTSGKDLGVHPGLVSSTASSKVRQLMEKSLLTNLPKGRLRAMAIMGLPQVGPEPWIFLAIAQTSDGKFVAAPGFNTPTAGQKAQALSFVTKPNFVLPGPVTNNLAPITNKKLVAAEARHGVSTAVLFQKGLNPDAKAETGQGESITGGDPEEGVKNRDIIDIVGDPARSHFFNTDCVSCHTETTRAEILKIASGGLAFKKPLNLSNLSDDVIPTNVWNVRNFGWGPPREAKPTVSRRAFNETAESAEYINNHYRLELTPSD